MQLSSEIRRSKLAPLWLSPPPCDAGKLQVSEKFGVIYVVTKMGLLFVYDLETASAIYRNRISPDPIFLTVDAPSTGGFYAINRAGQVLHVTINEQTCVPFISTQLNNLDLALAIAQVRGCDGAPRVHPQYSCERGRGAFLVMIPAAHRCPGLPSHLAIPADAVFGMICLSVRTCRVRRAW